MVLGDGCFDQTVARGILIMSRRSRVLDESTRNRLECRFSATCQWFGKEISILSAP